MNHHPNAADAVKTQHFAGQKSPIAWVGGKSRLAATIIERLPEHRSYVEPFAGGAWVLFGKPPSRVEIINDINSELVTLYRCIKHHLSELVAQFKWLLNAHDEFDRFMATPPETLTDIQRAARFYYLNKTAFGAKAAGQNYGLTVSQPPRLNLLRLEEDFSAAHLRLHRVQIENRPYSHIIDRCDRDDTLFYLDPPYWGCENDYGKLIFERADFARLAEQLARIKGKFILSLNDTLGVREVFADFEMEEVKTRYSMAASSKAKAKSQSTVGELLIRNF